MTASILAAACLALGLPLAAQAQLSPAAKLGQVAANQLGLLEYCHATGHAAASAVAAEREAVLGAPPSSLSTVFAEEFGRKGISVDPDGPQITIAELATRQSTTVPALCEDLARSSLQFQAAIHRRPGASEAPGGTAP